MAARLTCFAYGSNLYRPRLLRRVPDARALGAARLAGHELRFHKVGMDGSGKCDAFAVADPASVTFGALYQLSAAGRARLDAAEGLGRGYREARVRVLTSAGEEVPAFLYQATRIDPALRPFSWYLDHVIAGALDWGLPEHWIARLRGTPTLPDPDARRAARQRLLHAG